MLRLFQLYGEKIKIVYYNDYNIMLESLQHDTEIFITHEYRMMYSNILFSNPFRTMAKPS
jgi:hypothetical protein